MDVVSSAAAVVSLAIQLAGTVQTIRQLLRSIEHGPKELITLGDLLDQIHETMKHVERVVQSQASMEYPPASYNAIRSAMTMSRKRLAMLEDFIGALKASFARQRWLKKARLMVKIVSNKEDIQVLQSQLRDALSALHMAISTNSADVQYVTSNRVQ